MEALIEQLQDMLASFNRDPPDTDYQRGYEAAVIEILDIAIELELK